MMSPIQLFTKEIFMKIGVETFLENIFFFKKVKVLQLKWSGSATQMEHFHSYLEKHWIIV